MNSWARWKHNDAPIVSMFGFASPWKDVSLAIQAFADVKTPLRFILCGPTWLNAGLAGIELTHAAAPNVTTIGSVEVSVQQKFLDITERQQLIHASDAGLFPYVSNDSFQGSGAVNDYLSAGVPVIASDVGSLHEICGDAGILVPTNSQEHLSKALNTIVDSRNLEQITIRARQRSTLFSPTSHAEQCLDLYEKVISTNES